ncbi:MAG: hypothetical protein GY869_22035 [Planctomycetes bacterium]|nr:hypothetical protein [Planctomycetota bacterium]
MGVIGVILFYVLIGAVVLTVAVVLYMFAVGSRKSYQCKECGEKLRTEYLDAKRCGMCGAPINREDNSYGQA